MTLNHEHFNRPGIKNHIPSDHVTGSDYAGRVNIPGVHQVSGWPSGYLRTPVEESIDQICQLFAGLGMVTRLVDNWATYNNDNLTQKAGKKLFQIFDWIPNHNPYSFFDGGKWTIFNPVTIDHVRSINTTGNANAGGAQLLFLSKGAVKGLSQTAQGNGVSSSQVSGLWQQTFIPAIRFTSEQEQSYKDSLLNEVYATGDTTLIRAALSFYGNSNTQNQQKNARLAQTNGAISLYPNPSNGTFVINTTSNAAFDIEVLNQFGQTVYNAHAQKGPHIIVSLPATLPAGTFDVGLDNFTMQKDLKLTIIR